MHQIHILYKLGVMQTTSWGLAHTAIRKRLTSPQGNRLLNSMPVIGVPVGGSRMLESIINHSTLRGRFCISLYSSSNMSRNISSLCTWQITTMTLHNEESLTCVAQELRNELYIIHKHIACCISLVCFKNNECTGKWSGPIVHNGNTSSILPLHQTSNDTTWPVLIPSARTPAQWGQFFPFMDFILNGFNYFCGSHTSSAVICTDTIVEHKKWGKTLLRTTKNSVHLNSLHLSTYFKL